jgi:hypothetical protein
MKAAWRSLLFVPANNARLIESAHTRGADALILDLEDAVPVADKPAARAALPAAIAQLAGHGAAPLVRINQCRVFAIGGRSGMGTGGHASLTARREKRRRRCSTERRNDRQTGGGAPVRFSRCMLPA